MYKSIKEWVFCAAASFVFQPAFLVLGCEYHVHFEFLNILQVDVPSPKSFLMIFNV